MKVAKNFDTAINFFHTVLNKLTDKRLGKNKSYEMKDAALSAFSVFFTQNPSFLAYQNLMSGVRGKNNAQSLFGVHKIPCDNQIRKLLDGVKPQEIYPVFEEILQLLIEQEELHKFRSFQQKLLLALDGTEYFSSQKIHCPQCSRRKLKSGKQEYFHSVVTPIIVNPQKSQAIPLIPEFIVPQDGHSKQDCETAAAKRWLSQYGTKYQSLSVTILGDDLYCHQPLCQLLLEQNFDFILVCKPSSHPTLYEHLEGIDLPTIITHQGHGKVKQTYTYRYLNQVPLRNSDDALLVNWCELTITRTNGEVVFHNCFATNHLITDHSVAPLIRDGRSRWKIENENNNTLKTKGYNLAHNFGHGKKYLSSNLATLNILSFLFHTLLDLLDPKYQTIRSHLTSRKTFFDDLRALTRYLYFDNWEHLLNFMAHGLEIDFSSDSS